MVSTREMATELLQVKTLLKAQRTREAQLAFVLMPFPIRKKAAAGKLSANWVGCDLLDALLTQPLLI